MFISCSSKDINVKIVKLKIVKLNIGIITGIIGTLIVILTCRLIILFIIVVKIGRDDVFFVVDRNLVIVDYG